LTNRTVQKSQDKKNLSDSVSFADLFEASLKKAHSLRRNQEVVGTVVAVSPQEVLIDIGAKSEGIVVGRELSAVSDMVSKLSVGDKVDATVIFPENDAGQVVLSLRKLSGERRWTDLEEKKDNDEDIEVVALEVNRGGVICDYLGIRGFLPASQLSTAPSKLSDLIGKNLSARVIEVDRTTNRLILSQKSPDKKDLTEVLKLLSKVKMGETVKGLISAVLPFGIFVEIDLDSGAKAEGKTKLEGLVHVSEISWDKIDDPVKMFNVGDEVEVMVIAKDETSGRLNLSLKQLQEDPFAEISKKYTKEQEVSGPVAKVTPYGVFVTLEDNLDGLIHISKIPPDISFEVGQMVSCTVDSIDNKSRRIALVPIAKAKPILYR
jgi:ribosomal protein S1